MINCSVRFVWFHFAHHPRIKILDATYYAQTNYIWIFAQNHAQSCCDWYFGINDDNLQLQDLVNPRIIKFSSQPNLRKFRSFHHLEQN